MLEAGILLLFLLILITLALLVWWRVAGRPRTTFGRIGRLVAVSVVMSGLVAILTYQWMNARTFQLFGEIIPSVATTQPLIALTFDDGPTTTTPEILAILKEKGIKASFYLIGQNIERHPEIVAAILADGHEVGNHTYSHQRMLLQSWDFIHTEIERTDQLIRAAGYTAPIHFRSPYGKKLVLLPFYLSQHNKKNIFFNVEPESFANVVNDPAQIVAHTVEQTKPGSIILLHPENAGFRPSFEALPRVIDELQAKGYTFVTVSELLAAAP